MGSVFSLAAGADPRARLGPLLELLLPVVLVALALAIGLRTELAHYGGDLSGFVQFGSHFVRDTHPPRGSVILRGASSNGYDGQFYYVLARDPLLLHHSTLADLDGQVFRAERIGYPALAALVSHAARVTLPLALVSVNVAVVVFLTLGFAWYARSRGWSGLWALALGLLPGFLLATLRDLTDPLATAAALSGLIAYSRGYRWSAGLLLSLAVLTREPMALVVVAVAIDAATRAWHERRAAGSVRETIRGAAPTVVLPALAFLGWELYVIVRNGGVVGHAALRFPTFVSSISAAIHSAPAKLIVWDVTYEVLILAAVVAALILVWRNRSTFAIAAMLVGVSMFFSGFQPIWGDTRDSLPVLALLLVAGLEQQHRAVLGICVAAAAMTALIPFAIPGLMTV